MIYWHSPTRRHVTTINERSSSLRPSEADGNMDVVGILVIVAGIVVVGLPLIGMLALATLDPATMVSLTGDL